MASTNATSLILRQQAAAACAPSAQVNWSAAECVASVVSASSNSCPSALHKTWRPSMAEGCRHDGVYIYQHAGGARGDEPFAFRGPFNRSSAFAVGRGTCASFPWTAHATGPRQLHSGPAILGADRDIKHVLQKGDASGSKPASVNLLRLGMRPDERAHAGLWAPCTNLAYVLCAMQGCLPGQGGPNFYVATRVEGIGRRCRPCGPCAPDLHAFNECAIVKSELCALAVGCRNGAEVVRAEVGAEAAAAARGAPAEEAPGARPHEALGAWRCDLDAHQLAEAKRVASAASLA